MQAKRRAITKLGLVCSTAAFLVVSGCSIWQGPSPERYGLAPGPKRIPALNPGGELAQPEQPVAPNQAQQQPLAANGFAGGQPQQPQQFASQPQQLPLAAPVAPSSLNYAPPAAYAPPPQPFAAPPPPVTYAPTAIPLPPQAAGYAEPAALTSAAPPFPTAPQQPFDLASTSLDRETGYPSLSQVPQAPALSANRVNNAQNAANELQNELNQSEAQRFAATQQVSQDGLPWGGVPQQPVHAPVAPNTFEFAAPVAGAGGHESLDEIDRRFAGPRVAQDSLATLPSATFQQQPHVPFQPQIAAPYAPAAPLEIPAALSQTAPEGMIAIAPAYNFPAPAAPRTPFPVVEPVSLPTAELPPIKLVPPAFEFDEGSVALDVPPVRERFVPEPPAIAVPAKEEIYVPPAPSVASASNSWDEYAAPADAIVLTPPPEAYLDRPEGFLPESRYEKRRRFQRRKTRF